ncbi:MAG: type I methionyl aminopeptidase [Myxococcales bacterium]|jgi:methionyl aminopeptidase|nr:MAG: type I methionyl aminopeptidase [Myxococcales bacterium]
MIELKSPSEIERMRKPARIVGEILAALREMVVPGITTGELDGAAERMIEKAGARSAFKNYRVGSAVFPAVLCTSVNEEIVHGIPSEARELLEGDIVSLDFGVEYGGYYGDSAMTLPVGTIDEESRRLLEVTERSLYAGIDHLHPGERLGDVGAAVQEVAEGAGYSVVREFVGHGIGQALHEEPQVPNYGERGRGRALRVGMVLAVEPMVNLGAAGVRVLKDGWTAVTEDGRRSAHFEHTIAVTATGPEILTRV